MKDAPSRELKLFGNKKERQHYGELQHSEISGIIPWTPVVQGPTPTWLSARIHTPMKV